MRFQHYKNGKHYIVVNRNIMIQENDVWVPAYLYCACDHPHTQMFVRSKAEFEQKFTKVD